jgi:hypothetical protein
LKQRKPYDAPTLVPVGVFADLTEGLGEFGFDVLTGLANDGYFVIV